VDERREEVGSDSCYDGSSTRHEEVGSDDGNLHDEGCRHAEVAHDCSSHQQVGSRGF